jgi:hypothetical protein
VACAQAALQVRTSTNAETTTSRMVRIREPPVDVDAWLRLASSKRSESRSYVLTVSTSRVSRTIAAATVWCRQLS